MHETDCLCLQTRRADRLLTRLYDSFIKKTGLKSTQYGLLRCVRHLANPCMSDVGKALCLDQTTVTRNMEKLLKGGYVQMEPSGEDSRRTMIKITPLGYEKLAEARDVWEKAQDRVKAQLGEEDFKSLFALLGSLTEALEKED